MRSLLGLLSVVVLAVAANTSSGAIIALTDAVGDPASVNVAPGDSFNVTATFTLEDGKFAGGLEFYLNASTSSIFTITARSIDAANPFTDPTNTNAQVLSTSPGLNPTNGADLGGTTDTGLPTTVAGTYALYTFTLTTSATAPQGTYHITVVNAFYSDINFDTQDVGTTIYDVQVPEPVSIGMMGAFVGSLTLRRRSC